MAVSHVRPLTLNKTAPTARRLQKAAFSEKRSRRTAKAADIRGYRIDKDRAENGKEFFQPRVTSVKDLA
jgi:hypothetical protein